MNKRIAVLFLTTLVVGAIFWFNAIFSDWFGPKKIQIAYRIFAARSIGNTQGPTIIFYLDKPQPIISIQVFEETDAQKNQYPHALWHLVAAAGPISETEFAYGANVPGMKPEIPQSVPEPLQSGNKYRLVIETKNKIKGEITFNPPAN